MVFELVSKGFSAQLQDITVTSSSIFSAGYAYMRLCCAHLDRTSTNMLVWGELLSSELLNAADTWLVGKTCFPAKVSWGGMTTMPTVFFWRNNNANGFVLSKRYLNANHWSAGLHCHLTDQYVFPSPTQCAKGSHQVLACLWCRFNIMRDIASDIAGEHFGIYGK